ncbi:MAG: SPFH domain-containing protein [Ruminococcus sp.]|nr:SPFH domain-containing protein [Ruminococcus sp.]
MGLIRAALVGAATTLADTWEEFFVCDSIPADVIVVRGKKQLGKHSSNKKGNENVISDGSSIVVHEGQAMIMVDQGIVTEIATEPGIYKYDTGTSPSLFSSTFGAGLKNTFKEMWDRIKHGGDAAKDQRIYYFNMKELLDNKFGTQNPVPFRVTYQDLNRSFTVGVRCNGIYSYKIADPVLFYANVCGNVSSSYSRSELDGQLKSEFLDSLQPAFAKISASGIRYDELPGRQREVKDAIETELTSDWKDRRGLQLEKVAINSATISAEDTKRIQEFEDRAWNTNPTNAAATLVEAQAQAMQNAANNPNGAAMGLFGMGMANQMGGMNAQGLFNMGAQQGAVGATTSPNAAGNPASAATAGSWNCECGTANTGKFCNNCGKPKPAPANSWKCQCGADNTGKFCNNCGKPKPADAAPEGWTCSCGAINKGKFCAECGKPKPAGAPLYRCDKCGWEPEDPFNPPKFCAECGDPFDDSDIVK